MKRFVTVLLLVLALPLACADPVAPNHGIRPGGILFVSSRSGDPSSYDVFRINPDGTGVDNVTRTPAGMYGRLTLSPDGSRVAFMSDRDGCYNIWTMNGDGTDVTQLTGLEPTRRCAQNPFWSPDGTRIAFIAQWESDQEWHVHVMDADGGNAHRVSFVSSPDSGAEYAMGWTPDGRVIFWRVTGSTSRIYTVETDGTGTEPLFDGPSANQPVWSPDGAHMAFTRSDVGTSFLVVRNGAGAEDTLATMSTSEPADLIAIPGAPRAPWSPDGTRIAFYFIENGIRQLAVADIDGAGGVRRLTADAAHASWFNSWSPDGSRLLFTSDPAGTDDVYAIKVDGTGLLNLTDDPAQDRDALWLPMAGNGS